MLADHVKCLSCKKVMYVPICTEICPKCGKDGDLIFANVNKPEVEISEEFIEGGGEDVNRVQSKGWRY